MNRSEQLTSDQQKIQKIAADLYDHYEASVPGQTLINAIRYLESKEGPTLTIARVIELCDKIITFTEALKGRDENELAREIMSINLFKIDGLSQEMVYRGLIALQRNYGAEFKPGMALDGIKDAAEKAKSLLQK